MQHSVFLTCNFLQKVLAKNNMVQELLELDRLNDKNVIKLSRMEQIYTILDWTF
jgi:hypothetical protein